MGESWEPRPGMRKVPEVWIAAMNEIIAAIKGPDLFKLHKELYVEIKEYGALVKLRKAAHNSWKCWYKHGAHGKESILGQDG